MEEVLIKSLLNKASSMESLSRNEAFSAFDKILKGDFTHAQISSLLTSLKIKGENVDEIAGAAAAMRESSLKVPVSENIRNILVDTCGTGGDCKNTFNISTCASFIASGAGVKIAKHGNYAVSSKSGSADVLKELGVNILLEPDKVMESIEVANIGFLFAPKFHSAMKNAGPVRKELGFKTIFNILGPLTNPFGAERQVIGVYSGQIAPKIIEVLRLLGSRKVFVVHGKDGIDEVSLSSLTDVYELSDGNVNHYEFNPEDFGFRLYKFSEFKSSDPTENARIIIDILNGIPGPRLEISVLNAGFAIMASGMCSTFEEAFEKARNSVNSGSALKSLEKLINISNN